METPRTDGPPVIDLRSAPGQGEAWDRPRPIIYLWAFVELLLVASSWQPSSRLRAHALRWFGATIGEGVILRPRLRVRFPWKLKVGDGSWIGEDVWIHNQNQVRIGANAVISQGSFLTTGSHAHRTDMALVTRPILIEDGAWVTSRCIVLGGTTIGQSALVQPGTVVREDVPANVIYGAPSGRVLGTRFDA